MSPRDTGTGWVLEQIVLPALQRAGYEVFSRPESKLPDPFRPGRLHKLDVMLRHPKEPQSRIGIAAKWQQSSGAPLGGRG
jgi:hypothetical protein